MVCLAINFTTMKTPILTKSQKGKSLSAKQKKKPSVNIRNVLGVPSRDNTCSITTEDESQTFREKLIELFPCQPQVRLKWSVLKAIPKEKRKEFKESAQSNVKKPEHLDQLVFGINAVTRAVENAKVSLVLLANDVTPQLLIKHVIEACNVQEIPVIQVPKLREITKEILHFPAIAVAFKIPSENDPCHSVKQVFKSYIAKSIAVYNKTKNVKHIKENSDITETVVQPSKKVCVSSDENLYLYRNSSQVRAFIPPKSVKVNVQSKEDLDFIILDDSDDVIIIDDPECNNNYKNLKVKRLKPNSNRKKDKKKCSNVKMNKL